MDNPKDFIKAAKRCRTEAEWKMVAREWLEISNTVTCAFNERWKQLTANKLIQFPSQKARGKEIS